MAARKSNTPEVVDATVGAEGTTTLDSDTTKPSVTAPGDGPADTTDPREVAVSTPVNPGPEAIAAGTVNPVQKVEAPAEQERDTSNDRIDKYDVKRPDGKTVTVTHNLETGATSVSEPTE